MRNVMWNLDKQIGGVVGVKDASMITANLSFLKYIPSNIFYNYVQFIKIIN